MQISCFMQSSIFTPYGGILSNDLDFSKLNFVTKIPNFRSSKGPNKKCFLKRELQMIKLFHWHYVFTQTWYLEQETKWALPKIFARCAEIMRRDGIRWFDGSYVNGWLTWTELSDDLSFSSSVRFSNEEERWGTSKREEMDESSFVFLQRCSATALAPEQNS